MTLALTRLSFHPVFLSVCSAWRMTFVMRVRRGVICGSIFCNAFQVESAAALTGLLSALCHLPAPSPSKRGCCLFSFPFPSFPHAPLTHRTNYSHSLAPLSFHHRRLHPLKMFANSLPFITALLPLLALTTQRPPPTPISRLIFATSGSFTTAATLRTNIPMSAGLSSLPGQTPATQMPRSSSRRASRSAAKPVELAVPRTPRLQTMMLLLPRLCPLLHTPSLHLLALPGLMTPLLPLMLLPPLPSRPL